MNALKKLSENPQQNSAAAIHLLEVTNSTILCMSVQTQSLGCLPLMELAFHQAEGPIHWCGRCRNNVSNRELGTSELGTLCTCYQGTQPLPEEGRNGVFGGRKWKWGKEIGDEGADLTAVKLTRICPLFFDLECLLYSWCASEDALRPSGKNILPYFLQAS